MFSHKRLAGRIAIPLLAITLALFLSHYVSYLHGLSSATSLNKRAIHNLEPTLAPRVIENNVSVNTTIPGKASVNSRPQSKARLLRRAEPVLTDEAWNQKVAKGQSINCLFPRPIAGVQPQSEWTSWKAITDWGWTEGDMVPELKIMDDDPNFSKGGAMNIGLNIGSFLKEQGYPDNSHELPWHMRKLEHKGSGYTPPGGTKELQVCFWNGAVILMRVGN